MKLGKKLRENANGKKVRKRIFEKSEGFTFVETLAVLAIGAVMAAGSSVAVARYVNLAKETAAKNQIEQYTAALQSYFLDCGRFPTTEQGIGALWEKPILYPVPENWDGPYLERKPSVDPWGTDFKYFSSESSSLPSEVPENMPFVLISYGADKEQGGEGNGSDICSWK